MLLLKLVAKFSDFFGDLIGDTLLVNGWFCIDHRLTACVVGVGSKRLDFMLSCTKLLSELLERLRVRSTGSVNLAFFTLESVVELLLEGVNLSLQLLTTSLQRLYLAAECFSTA